MTNELLRFLRSAVREAVTDGAVCVVSGGIDSSTVTTLVREVNPGVATFTGWYDLPGFDERRWARLVTDPGLHTEVLIGPDDFVEWFDVMAGHVRRPFMGPGAFGQFMVAKAVAEVAPEATVLSGEGGDELFGGYVRLQMVAGEPRKPGYEDYRLPDGYPTDLEAALTWEWKRLPDLLAVDEQMCGAWGLTSKAPLLDYRVVGWAMTQPARMRVGKRLLREAVAGMVPQPIIDRRDKQGFPIPLVQWAHTHDGVRRLVEERIGYLPDPQRPYDRGWWHDLLDVSAREPV